MALSLAGMMTGFLAGLLGVAGGGLLVPVLYETFGAVGVDEEIRMHLALGTALAVIIPTSTRSFFAHRAKGTVDLALLARIAPWLVAGVVVGILIAGIADSAALRWIWVVAGTVMSLKMVLGRDDWRLGSELPGHWGVEAFCFLVGIVSVLLSIGGAIFIVTLLTLYNRPLLQAVSTSSGLGPLVAIPGVVGFAITGWGAPGLPPLSVGYVSLIGAALIIPASVLMAPVGVRFAHGIPKRSLELAFAAFLALVALRFFVSLVF
ncbi:MAG: sulfite exporter TauE/SafE family protein, partial [Hyphomicrobiaceae bacterium]|nr:sulfite exporter TauE/SafE family protein [Hyphomicrobiaceae bacterium]